MTTKLPWKRVLCFGAHPDDEIIGPGGTLARAAREGARVTVVTFCLGETGFSKKSEKGTIADARRREAAAADRALGVHRRILLGKPTQGVTNDKETFRECVKIIREVRPDVIFSHGHGDKHRDHRAIAAVTEEAWWKASENAAADLGPTWLAPEFYHYEVSDLIAHPTLVVDITATFAAKSRALATQKSQMGVLPGIQRYIEGLAAARGYLRGTKYAEAFQAGTKIPRPL